MELVEKITVRSQVDETFSGRENRFCYVELDAKSYEEIQDVLLYVSQSSM
jgi:hypothetical protein